MTDSSSASPVCATWRQSFARNDRQLRHRSGNSPAVSFVRNKSRAIANEEEVVLLFFLSVQLPGNSYRPCKKLGFTLDKDLAFWTARGAGRRLNVDMCPVSSQFSHALLTVGAVVFSITASNFLLLFFFLTHLFPSLCRFFFFVFFPSIARRFALSERLWKSAHLSPAAAIPFVN